eukprot:gnl/MRDRNA2_/MRDRNA2_163441_c0_seq1.p1 gnl/MRDRNA2_/MRDRNA2_163441_c0~~gnl/MRDRNA2_/MRDRNA2_163441_c0_seq1.p1  ORF type:complete len:251 (+),score=43.45 gnl/MRDRNA2_/MRDRNA2_163441_c0_seq1:72-824(+)
MALACVRYLSKYHKVLLPLRQQARWRTQLPNREALTKLSLKELQGLADANKIPLAGCFEKAEVVHRIAQVQEMKQKFAQGAAESARTYGSTAGSAESILHSHSVKELRALISKAGLNSDGLFEKDELLSLAKEAQKLLAAKAHEASKKQKKETKAGGAGFSDAVAYRSLEVVMFGRFSCPHCSDAIATLRARGIQDFVALDVEFDLEAAKKLRRLGGSGVPFFHSEKTGRTLEGWNPGQPTLDWLIRKLS